MVEFRFRTERLVLREWRDADIRLLDRMNADPEVMRFIGPARSHDQNVKSIRDFQAMQAEFGFTCWAVEFQPSDELIGYCGFHPGAAGTPVEGEVEIAWRFVRDAWGKGFAREAAMECLAWAVTNLPSRSIWSKTVPANKRSWRLMRRIGMQYQSGSDFDHPALAAGDPLRRHVLYRIDPG